MTQEEKQLLVKDLCARLPYGVKISWRNDDVEHKVFELSSITSKKYETYKEDGKELAVDGEYIEWRLNENKMGKFYRYATLCDYIKPYLRPMSSMTEEECKEFALLQTDFYTDGILYPIAAINMISWLNAHHFDYRGLIPMGLALEAPEDMYKIVLEAPKDMYKTENSYEV